MRKIFILAFCVSLYSFPVICQGQVVPSNQPGVVNKDSLGNVTPPDNIPKTDTVKKKSHSPRKAAIRSAILPGWGQVYNKKYWKLPIVYGALGTSGAIFFYNLKNYRNTRFAYKVKYAIQQNNDSTGFHDIANELKPLSAESLRFYRNQFRRDIDYAALFFLLLWGLNVVDATVDAHLKGFDVSPDLGLKIKPGYSNQANTTGLSIILYAK